MNPPQRPTTPKLQGPRPAPLKLSKNSIKIKKPPPHPLRHNPPPPQQHFHHPVVIYTVSSVNEFMSLIQRLTGPSSSPPAARHGFPLLSLSPAMDSRPTPHRPFLQKHPSCFICNADEMDVDDVVSDPNSSSPFSNLRQTGSYLMVTASGNQASPSIHCRRRPDPVMNDIGIVTEDPSSPTPPSPPSLCTGTVASSLIGCVIMGAFAKAERETRESIEKDV